MTKTWSRIASVIALIGATTGCASDDTQDAEQQEQTSDAVKDAAEQKDAKSDDKPATQNEEMGAVADESAQDKKADKAQASEKPASETQEAELDHTQDIRGHCKIKTDFADDHACLPAPKPSEGIQIHIGPSNYDDPEEVAKFIMHPGEESSQCFTLRTPNKEKITYQGSALSGRAGTHHMINTIYEGELPTGSFGPCEGRSTEVKRVGSLPGASKPFMPRSKIAPEYAHVGQTLDADALVQADMHYFNFTDKDILREVWINLYYAPPDTVTEYSDVIRGFGGLGWNQEPIAPGTDKVYKYECPIKGDGNILNLLGHYHAHGKRFGASLKRKNGEIEKVFEMFNYLEPATFDYNSVVQNPKFSQDMAGATSGILKVQDGDVLQWECHIINDGMVGLRYTNEVVNGEMCNVWGYSIGSEPIVCDLR